jgi:Flp pilus assembly protein CpaB
LGSAPPSSPDKEQETVELTGKNYSRNDWRKALGTRRGTVIVAGVCALVAAGILLLAMNRYRHNVDTSGNQETVFVASGLIQKGTPGDAIASGQLFKSTSVAVKQVSTGAIADTAQLHGKVATADIYPGQQLTATAFTANGGLAARLAPNQRAMTITLDQSHGMVGQIHSGDHVDVYAGVSFNGTGRSEPALRLLMSNVQVLQAGAATSGGLGASQNPTSSFSNVTLNVVDSQAPALAYASDNGKVWLVLRPANAASATQSSAITAQSLLLGSKPAGAGGGK